MSKRPKPPATLKDAISLVSQHNKETEEQVLRECRNCWDSDSPLSHDLLKKFAWFPSASRWLADFHPFYPVYDAMLQVETAYDILSEARKALIELYGHYHATLMYDGFSRTEEIGQKTTHEVFKYVFAATTLVQAYRRFDKAFPAGHEAYTAALAQSFHDRELQAFVQRLRNCYGHQTLLRVEPWGKVKIGSATNVESSLIFDKEFLLGLKDAWNTEARSYLDRSEKLNVLEVVNKYHEMASDLFLSYGSATGAVHSVGFKEIVRCKQAIWVKRQCAALGMILQIAKQQGADPYKHLPKHFTKEEMERIQCFPSYSQEQVDYMISLRDPLGLCSGVLRRELYELFGC
ncbi:hypothetical protein [Roseovarius pacificus]|uniref:hypothetical protein n=1 Tax=Roseovarius pacificus TaxID=337701 RepID=UPI002A18A7E2|nr:hypothetical protein [Roseovarius pacificus]